MGRHLTKWLHNPGSNRALVFYTPYTPSRPGRWGRQRHGLSYPQPVVLRQWVPCSVNAALVVSVVVATGGEGGGKEAHGTPGGVEEYDDWGRKIGRGGQGSARAERRGGLLVLVTLDRLQ
jgi:hypothetical protein